MRIMCAVAESNPSTADSAEWARSNISSSITHTLTFFDFRCRIGNNQVPSESKVNKRSVIFFFSRRRRQHGPYNPVASFQRAAEAREYLKNYKTDVSKIAGRVRVKRKQGEFNFFFANEASPPTLTFFFLKIAWLVRVKRKRGGFNHFLRAKRAHPPHSFFIYKNCMTRESQT